MKVEFFHAFNPPKATAQTRRHTSHGRTYLPERTKLAAATMQAILERDRPVKPLEGAVYLTITWTWPGNADKPKVTRPDLDNLCKLALDAATKAGYWHDDAQVVLLTAAKFFGTMPGIAFTAEAR